jgi:archaeosortase B (VPXXXP-CTERM-specific)
MAVDQPASNHTRFNPVARWSRLSPAVRFVVTFLVTLGILSLVYPELSVRYNAQMLRFMAATASAVGLGLKVLGQAVTVDGRYISTPGISVEVIEECTGAYEIIIFWAAVLAYPARWRARVIGLFGGMIALLLINVLRMMLLVAVGNRWPQSFQFMHIYFWQATLILMIVSVWILWIKMVASRPVR